MAKNARVLAAGLVAVFFTVTLFVSGCTRYANEKQMTTLDEAKASVTAAEENTAKLEKENAELKAKLAEKQAELKQVQAEKDKIKSQVGK
jgi:septal ring factor EnvC (AmiA/AmiB activator)